MKLIRVSHCIGNVPYGQIGQLEQFCRLYHPVVHQEFLRGLPEGFFKDPSEVTPVQTAGSSDPLHADIILKIGAVGK